MGDRRTFWRKVKWIILIGVSLSLTVFSFLRMLESTAGVADKEGPGNPIELFTLLFYLLVLFLSAGIASFALENLKEKD